MIGLSEHHDVGLSETGLSLVVPFRYFYLLDETVAREAADAHVGRGAMDTEASHDVLRREHFWQPVEPVKRLGVPPHTFIYF